MTDLGLAVGALVVVLVGAYFFGKKRKREGLANVLAQPDRVARIYLRAAPEIDAYWLHAKLRNGRKARIAAPWEIVETLARLGGAGCCGCRTGCTV